MNNCNIPACRDKQNIWHNETGVGECQFDYGVFMTPDPYLEIDLSGEAFGFAPGIQLQPGQRGCPANALSPPPPPTPPSSNTNNQHMAGVDIDSQARTSASPRSPVSLPDISYAGTVPAQGLPRLTTENCLRSTGGSCDADSSDFFNQFSAYTNLIPTQDASYTFPPNPTSLLDLANEAVGPPPAVLELMAASSADMEAARAAPLPQYSCGLPNRKRCKPATCPSSFAQKKDLTRHIRSCHAKTNDPVYRCRCGTAGVRKDNYLRHVRTCTRELICSTYCCKCGTRDAEKDNHVDHVRNCHSGFGNRGRPTAS